MEDTDFPIFPVTDDEADDFGEPIVFTSEDVDFSLPQTDQLRRWITHIIDQRDGQLRSLQYIFCSDEYLFQLNRSYLDHDTLTDIITFPYADPPTVHGDIFISVDRVMDNAKDYNVPFQTELRRVIIHGVLHLCGLGDKTKAEAARMRQAEEEALGEWEDFSS